MVKFKVGDKVRIIKGRGSSEAKSNMGKITTIKYIEIIGFTNRRVTSSSIHYGIHDIHHFGLAIGDSGVWPDEVELISKKECKTELDYLDAFQDNFRDGI